jgi:VanZ family protein
VKHTHHLLVHNLFKILAFLWTLLIFYLCLDDSPNVPKINFQHKDKVVHFILYFIFVYFWTKSFKKKHFNYLLIILLLALTTGIIIEFLQENYTNHRTFDWYDVLANFIGALASFIYVKKFYGIKNEFKISLW